MTKGARGQLQISERGINRRTPPDSTEEKKLAVTLSPHFTNLSAFHIYIAVFRSLDLVGSLGSVGAKLIDLNTSY